jgi:hypothetical protein
MNTVKPVLVTGAPRSGTTWVGRMLSTSPKLYYIHEPFNPDYRPDRGVCNVKFDHYQTYITEKNEKPYFEPIKMMIGSKYDTWAHLMRCRSFGELKKLWHQNKMFRKYRCKGIKPLIKDPIALLSAPWLSRRFDLNIVVMIRHPAAFVASMKRLNWGFDPQKWVFSQPQLMEDHLVPFEKDLRQLKESKAGILEQAAWFWKVSYAFIANYIKDHPDWIYLKHEEISLNPMETYQGLFKQLGLDFTDECRNRILEHSNASNPSCSSGTDKLIKLNSKDVVSQWKKSLNADEIHRVRTIVEDVSTLFYSEKEWDVTST